MQKISISLWINRYRDYYMTREEYERLLQSDYWKGYSYSLIKERNFTCEDCGRSFPNERNKLQVHHLVYRDANPWSYKPEELIVLCEDCHRKRHGMYTEPEQSVHTDSRSYYSTKTDNRVSINNNRFEGLVDPPKKNYNKYIIIGGIILIFALFVFNNFPEIELPEKKIEKRGYTSPVTEEKIPVYDNRPSSIKSVNTTQIEKRSNVPTETAAPQKTKESSVSQQTETKPYTEVKTLEENGDRLGEPYKKKSEDKELSTLELLERRQHEDVVRQAKRAGVSAEGSTIDILERIQHADVVKQAKRAGVSSEGSTIEILERIQHADVVKQAKRAGVSSEGSTIEILERIQHADVIKQAKRAGVSTEGSTIEILERIQRKELEKYNY